MQQLESDDGTNDGANDGTNGDADDDTNGDADVEGDPADCLGGDDPHGGQRVHCSRRNH